MTPQEKMQATLGRAGIPAKEIKVYGSQIMIVTRSRNAAERWGSLLTKFATLRAIVESVDENKVNKNTMLKPTMHKVWLVSARISVKTS